MTCRCINNVDRGIRWPEMRFLVHGVDGPGVDDRLESLAEEHWSYLDDYADRLVARGPTLTADGSEHTGSVHVIDVDDLEAARRFAFHEPYYRFGVYSSVTLARFQSLPGGSMWDPDARRDDRASTLARFTWPSAQPAFDDELDDELARAAVADVLVFGGYVLTDDGRASTGLVLALDLDPDSDALDRLVFGLSAADASVTIQLQRWQRGGRPVDATG
jgi:uncharacterized protein YciI